MKKHEGFRDATVISFLFWWYYLLLTLLWCDSRCRDMDKWACDQVGGVYWSWGVCYQSLREWCSWWGDSIGSWLWCREVGLGSEDITNTHRGRRRRRASFCHEDEIKIGWEERRGGETFCFKNLAWYPFWLISFYSSESCWKWSSVVY